MNQDNKPHSDTLVAEKSEAGPVAHQSTQPQPAATPGIQGGQQQTEKPRAEAPKGTGNIEAVSGGSQPLAQQPNKAAPQDPAQKR